LRDPELSSVTQAGFVNNLNDGMAWGLFPLLFGAAGLGLGEVGALVALYPAVWGLAQLVTGPLSDRLGRKGLIAGGMGVQAVGIGAVALGGDLPAFVLGQVLLGVGTAMVYPTLLAAIGDVAHPSWRASAVGVYRLWRDMGYALGALIAGLVADFFGITPSLELVAWLTFLSGSWVALRMRETRGASARPGPPARQRGDQPQTPGAQHQGGEESTDQKPPSPLLFGGSCSALRR
ncbi:MAG TPA: MFS transporter, partial [Myxococcota bacterium]|nr:MFS transporter [Myxococcota bacterium]